ncbi:hypothetical protein ABPG75_011215 [Micractinium tetrahymenae]
MRRASVAAAALAALGLLALAGAAAAEEAAASEAPSFYSSGLQAVDSHGRTVPMSEFAGKVTLVVNVASLCGYTGGLARSHHPLFQRLRCCCCGGCGCASLACPAGCLCSPAGASAETRALHVRTVCLGPSLSLHLGSSLRLCATACIWALALLSAVQTPITRA